MLVALELVSGQARRKFSGDHTPPIPTSQMAAIALRNAIAIPSGCDAKLLERSLLKKYLS